MNALLALPTKEGGNKGIKSKKGALKCCKENKNTALIQRIHFASIGCVSFIDLALWRIFQSKGKNTTQKYGKIQCSDLGSIS